MRNFGYYRSNGIILAHTEWSRSSARVIIFTEQDGLINSIAKGVRRNKNPFAASLELFTLSEIVYYRRQPTDLATLVEGYLVDDFAVMKNNLAKLCLSYNISNILMKTASYNEPDEQLYQFMVSSLIRLNDFTGKHLRVFLISFILKLLNYIGYGIHLKDIIGNGKYYGLYIPDGSLLYTDQLDEDLNLNLFRFSIAEYMYLKDLLKLEYTKIARLKPNQDECNNILLALERYLTYHYQKLIRFNLKYI
jgi:DNA repair protein RecO (recombination protein O)